MTSNLKIERKKLFRRFTRKKRNEMFDEKSIELEKISKHDLTLNKKLKDQATRLKQDIQILREIEIEDQSAAWND